MSMRRREFITLVGGTATTWPLAARAQQRKPMRRIGALIPLAASDPQVQARYAAFLQGLQQLGWTVGNNVQIESRWSAGNEDETRKYAAELVALAPDVIFTSGSAGLGPLQRATRTLRRSCSRSLRIRLARALSIVWRGRAATSPVLPRMNTASAQNGWRCSSRWCRA